MVFVKHGSRFVRVPQSHLVLVNPDTEARNMKLSNAQDNILKDIWFFYQQERIFDHYHGLLRKSQEKSPVC